MRLFPNDELWAQPWLADLGPEPIEIAADDFVARCRRRPRMIKPALLDQSFLAGIGNLYADEALFLAGIRPRRKADTLLEAEKRRLYLAIRQVLRLAVDQKGTSLADETYRGGQYQQQFLVYDREEQPCLKCGSPIQRIRLGQRSAHFCPGCQQ